MITNDELHAFAELRGHNVGYANLPKCKALVVELDKYYIGLDNKLRGSSEKAALAHELGHCETGTLYYDGIPRHCKNKFERIACAWSYRKLVPPNEIQKALNKGILEPWELAEHFDVPITFMKNALDYYYGQGIYFKAPEWACCI